MIKFNIVKLQEILKSVYELTHMKVSIHNEKREEIVNYPGKYNPFCELISESPAAISLCVRADKERFDEVDRLGSSKVFVCPFGLIEVFAPIIINGLTVGYMVLGQILSEDINIKKLAQKPAQYGFKEETVLEKLEKLEKKSDEIIQASTIILEACAKYVYIDKYIHISGNEMTNNIHNYIVEHISEKITADMLCHQFFLSRVSLYKLFNDQFHSSVADYIKNERIKMARELLQDSHLSIREVAEQVGLEYNYFSKVFYKAEGMNPKQFQKANSRY